MAKLLAGKTYDPATAVTKGTAASAMAAFDTTNLRLTVTVPASGILYCIVRCPQHGATTWSQFLLGVMEGATVRGKVCPSGAVQGTSLATTFMMLEAGMVVSGLTPSASITLDAAWGCETFVASSLLKYGGPANATANNDFGGISFEVWDVTT